MGASKQPNGSEPPSGKAAQGISHSEAWRLGTRVQLEFVGDETPVLHAIRFTPKKGDDSTFFEQGTFGYDFQWREVAKALSLVLLEYLIWDKADHPEPKFYFEGKYKDSPAAWLGSAVYGSNNITRDLFIRLDEKNITQYLATLIFEGENLHGRDKDHKDRRITINPTYLSPDCVEIVWNAKGKDTLNELDDIVRLADRIWQQVGVKKKRSLPEKVQSPHPPSQSSSASNAQGTNSNPPAPVQVTMPESFLNSMELLVKSIFYKTVGKKRKPASSPNPSPGSKNKPSREESSTSPASPSAPAEPAPKPFRDPSQVRIDPRLFEIQNPYGEEWDDAQGLVNFGEDGSEADIWRLRDAYESLLIFGAVGSGKTSSSGWLFASQYLQAGFGGLVLTAKTDEAKRWLRLCEQAGRLDDCIHVTSESGHKLNILQYEVQRPTKRTTITEDLIALLQCVIGVMSRSKRSGTKDDFWSNNTNDLMRNLFEVFLYADEPITIDRLLHFIRSAPQKPTTSWASLEYFGEIVTRAEKNAQKGSQESKEAFFDVYNYWTVAFPGVPDVTRGGYVAGFTAMAGTLTARGIREILGGETNLTPEMILSGKIVILDFPIKDSSQGGNMIQATWKLLFQQAIERRADKGLKSTRPVFLWEDEAHLFFSQHDVNFQPSTRDCRASHVMISQNIHNFLHLGHDMHAVHAVFSAINTYILHTNFDYETNLWASKMIGEIRQRHLTTSGLLRAIPDEEYSIRSRRPEEIKGIGDFKISEKIEPAFPTNEFGKLKRGGDGTCEALILWLSHQFAVNKNQNFCVRTFQQEPRQT